LPYKKTAVYCLHLASLVALCYAYGSDGRFYPTKGGASFDNIVHTLLLDFEDIYVTVACLVLLSACQTMLAIQVFPPQELLSRDPNALSSFLVIYA
jgi:uncharacterized lipoprotein YajG